MDIIYRKAEESDIRSLVELSTSQDFDEVRPGYFLDRIKNGVCVVADYKKHIIGFRCGVRFCGDIFGGENFLISEKHRNKGIGTKLSKYMFKELKKAGYKAAITGNSDYYPPVKGAMVEGKWKRPTEFYKRLGYELIKETEKTRLFIIDLEKV